MGILVARRYRTAVAAGLADHTYVECSTGKEGWSCWGGKSGGTQLRSAAGSTHRADLIAGKHENAGIGCYAINGVCHQSANRILFSAKATVRGARGYKVSEALYGPYGRFRGPLGTCRAPFNQFPNVIDDLPECAVEMPHAEMAMESDPERPYLRQAMAIYESFGVLESPELTEDDHVDLHVRLFMHMASHVLGDEARIPKGKLQDVRAGEERSRIKIERAFMEKSMGLERFVDELNRLTVQFQRSIADALPAEDYTALLGLIPGDSVVLVDPAIAKDAYPGR